MGLDYAYAKAVESVTRVDPRTASSSSGVEFDKNRFIIPLFNRIYTVRFPDCEIAEIGACARVPKVFKILLMHYLTHADGTDVSGVWISYRQLPGAKLFEQKFVNLVSRPMIEFFGSEIDRFRDLAIRLGGKPVGLTGDAAFVFTALPRFPIACVLNIGEDEMPPYANILFDRSAPHYLPTEDVSILGGLMLSFLKRPLQRLVGR